MKAAFFALVSFAVSALANPILAARRYETQAGQIDRLTDLVKIHTAAINKTTLAVQDNPTTAQQNAAAADLAPHFQAITDALKSATTAASSSSSSSKREFDGGASCDHDCLVTKVQLLVWEIACTLRLVIVKLGLACVLSYLTPLLLALVGLVKALDRVVVGLLLVVKALLTTVLGTVAAALLKLIF